MSQTVSSSSDIRQPGLELIKGTHLVKSQMILAVPILVGVPSSQLVR
jgi:hypothetical protein